MVRKLTDEELKEWQDALRHIGARIEIGDWGEKNKKPISNSRSQTSAPQARLDLHGLTLERAHKKFLEFIVIAAMEGQKKLLVITGKGNPGKIRYELPKWCEADYLQPFIASCSTADAKHGGAGAFIIKLRN